MPNLITSLSTYPVYHAYSPLWMSVFLKIIWHLRINKRKMSSITTPKSTKTLEKHAVEWQYWALIGQKKINNSSPLPQLLYKNENEILMTVMPVVSFGFRVWVVVIWQQTHHNVNFPPIQTLPTSKKGSAVKTKLIGRIRVWTYISTHLFTLTL